MTDAPDLEGSRRMMHIGELADRAEMSLRTIRHYDEVGLLRPSGRTTGGFRLYTERDLERLLVIRRMKPLGYSLEEMSQLLKIVDATSADGPAGRREDLHGQLEDFRESARERRSDLARKLAMADEFVGLLGEL